MKIMFATDFHLGRVNRSHTSSRSQKAYKEALYSAAMEIGDIEADFKVCLGDLFDKHTNSEDIINQGIDVASKFDYTLCGNHDVLNVADKCSSFDIVKRALSNGSLMYRNEGTRAEFDNLNVEVSENCQVRFFSLGHYFTQELFKQSLENCTEFKNGFSKSKYDKVINILLLHCNVGDGYGEEIESEGSSLYLTSELQNYVKENYDYVFVGHEHVASRKGNIIVMGNSFPVHFGEIDSDRHVYFLDIDDKGNSKVTSEVIYSYKDSYEVIACEELMASNGQIVFDKPFALIEGSLDVELRPELARAIIAFWKLNESSLLAVKNGVEITSNKKAKAKAKDVDIKTALIESAKKAGFYKELEELMSDEN